jgi:hypothetical protein
MAPTGHPHLRPCVLASSFGLASVLFIVPHGAADELPAPEHLTWAVKLLKDTKPEATSYRHRNTSVRWKGIDGARSSESHTDCSGLLNDLFKRSYGLTDAGLQKWLGSKRPLAKHYYQAVVTENQFRRIKRLADVVPGDVIVVKYDPKTAPGRNTGHTLLAAGKPRRRKPTRPQVDGTEQWEVAVMDQSRSGHGKTDTRRKPGGGYSSGLGQGVFRIYTTRDGAVAGYTWSTFAKSRFYDQKDRLLVVGRLVAPPKP